MSDQDRVKVMRRELEGWREILVGLHSILVWDKHYYPGITCSVISCIFLLIWYIDPAVLTFVSFAGLVITLSDYLVPQVTPWIFGSNNWTGTQERKYEKIVVSLAGACNTLHSFLNTMRTAKTTRPKTYFVTVTAALVLCAWIGSSVNNLFLTYLIVLFAVMFPGLRRQDILRKYFAEAMRQVAALLSGKSSGREGEGTKELKKE